MRTLHSAPVASLKRAASPLWERVEDWGAVKYHRDVGCDIVSRGATRTLLGLPLPSVDGPDRAASHDLDRWARIADRDLDDAIDAVARERKRHARQALDVEQVAVMVREAFPGLTTDRDYRPVAAVVRRGTRRQLELLELVTGEAHCEPPKPSSWTPMHEATQHIRDVMTTLVWSLSLVLFGRERDPVSDYALGRLLKGEPIKDVRAPFASPAHALAVAAHDLPGLGGGSCSWPKEDPRMRRRTWSKGGEMSVRGGHFGTDHIRGEQAVHRVLDARNVERRAGLESHERAAVAVLNDRNLTRDQKATELRKVEALRRGVSWVCDSDVLSEQALRNSTADITDGELYGRAKDAESRLRAAVDRVSLEGDALAPKRQEKPRARHRERPQYSDVAPYIPGDGSALACV